MKKPKKHNTPGFFKKKTHFCPPCYEGRPRLSPEDVWGGEEVGGGEEFGGEEEFGGRAEGVWGMRCPHLREFRPHVRSCRAGGRGDAAVGDGGGGADDGGGVGGRVLGCWVRAGLVGGGGAAERVWAGGLAVSFVGGS